MWTLSCQLLLWILCAVNAEEQSFNVEVITAEHSNKAAIMSFFFSPSAVIHKMLLLRLMAVHISLLMFQKQQALCEVHSCALSPLISFWESFTGKFGWNVCH